MTFKSLLLIFFIYTHSSFAIVSKIEPDEDLGSTVTEADFYEIVGKVYSLYFQNTLNRQITVKTLDWKNPYISAWALEEKPDEFSINFWGGFARLPGMTRRAFALTVCHEIGHIIGGAPHHKIKDFQKLSAEGQSDFFASARCFKKYIEEFGDELEVTALSPLALDQCRAQFQDTIQQELCYSTAKAGQDLTAVLSYLSPNTLASFETPSSDIVAETLFDSYPSVQCRMDTFLVGALQAYPFTGNESLVKPACWFRK